MVVVHDAAAQHQTSIQRYLMVVSLQLLRAYLDSGDFCDFYPAFSTYVDHEAAVMPCPGASDQLSANEAVAGSAWDFAFSEDTVLDPFRMATGLRNQDVTIADSKRVRGHDCFSAFHLEMVVDIVHNWFDSSSGFDCVQTVQTALHTCLW